MQELHEECGVFAIAGHPNAAYLNYIGLLALQHRGQEAAGMVTFQEPDTFICHKGIGEVAKIFSKSELGEMQSRYSLGHVRYSTKGSNSIPNAQPQNATSECFNLHAPLWVASNGDVVNYSSQRVFLQSKGFSFYSTNDGELIAKSIYYNWQHEGDLVKGILNYMNYVRGTYSACCMIKGGMYAFRDPAGIRPLTLGVKDGAGIISSESCAIDAVGGKIIREVNPGEIINLSTLETVGQFDQALAESKTCIFEYIYFARPDSIMKNKLLWEARFAMGAELAKEDPEKDSDIVIPVPETGNPAAFGFSHERGIPLVPAIIKNHYVGRTFIQPEQSQREEAVRIKLNVMSQMVKGKNVKVIEDSIVRGTTTKILVKKLKEAGAAKVSLAISSPPVAYPCFYGIDTGVKKDLIASDHSIEEIRKVIGADHLQYLSFEGLLRACGGLYSQFCTACLTGDYPIDIMDGESLPGKDEWELGRQGR